MSSRRVSLAPVFRSDTQLGVLTATYLEPDRRFSIPDLMARVRKPQSTVAREVDRLAESGWVETELVHGRRSVWADPGSLIFDDLHQLLLKTVGPKPVLEQVLTGLPGLRQAFIYGSWARRAVGVAGPLPHDIDVLVVGAVDVEEARRRADIASDRLFRDVSIAVVSEQEWAEPSSGFLRQITHGDLVHLVVPLEP